MTTVRDIGPHEKVVTLEVSTEDLDAAMNQAARRLSREIKVKGFRPGRAPRRVIEAAVGTERLRSEALDDALPGLLEEALSDADLAPAVTPSLEKIEDHPNGIEVDVRITLWPTLEELPEYRGREVMVPSPEVDNEELRAQIDRLREQYAELAVVPRPSREGDFVAVNLSATHDGNPVDEASASDLLYELGSRSFIEGMDDELTEKSAGDIVSFRASLPEGFGELAGERVTVQALVKDVREKRLPALTDEWASDVSEFDTVHELEDELRDQLAQVKLASVGEAYRARTLELLIGEMDVDLPEGIVGAQMDGMLHRFVHQLAEQDIELTDYLDVTNQSQDDFLTDLRRQAEVNARTEILLEAVARAENVEVTKDEFNELAAALAGEASQDETEFLAALRGTSREIALRGDILRRKALAALLESAVPIDHNGSPIDLWPSDQTEELVGEDGATEAAPPPDIKDVGVADEVKE